MCLQFRTNLWGYVNCFRSGCRVCSHPTKNNNASRVQSAVWSCSSEVKRIFCISMWQWMKHGFTTTHLKQKDRQLSGQQLVKAVQSDQKLKMVMASDFGRRMVFCIQTGGKTRIACLRVERHAANCVSASQSSEMFIPSASTGETFHTARFNGQNINTPRHLTAHS